MAIDEVDLIAVTADVGTDLAILGYMCQLMVWNPSAAAGLAVVVEDTGG